MNKSQDFLTIKNSGQNELIIKKSKFITSIARTNSVAEAQTFISKISKKYHDATHNTFAYVIGKNDQQVKASDNGEPSGTAGVPELKALQLMKLKNVTVVVTRYFGGIKLGAGGLIRAYSNSVTKAIEKIGVVKRVLQQELIFKIPYHRLDEVNNYLRQAKIFIADTTYTTDVSIKVYLDLKEVTNFKNQLTNLLAGKVKIQNGNQRYHEVPIKQNNYHEQ